MTGWVGGSRVYDYLLGGVDNFEADRQASQHMAAAQPGGLAGRPVDRPVVADRVHDQGPYEINRRLLDGLASGSWLVATHLTSDLHGPAWDEAVTRLSEATREPFLNRTHDQFAKFFQGLDLVTPGVVPIDEWLRDGPAPPPADVEPRLPDDLAPDWINALWAAVARKP